MMHFVDEPGTRRLFVSTMRGAALQRQLRRQDRDAVSRHQRRDVGRRRAVAGRRSAASRASRSIRSSTSAARPASASSTRTPTPPNITPKPTSCRAPGRTARTTRCCSNGRPRIRPPRPTTAPRRASCSASRSRSRTTTAARSRSIRWRSRARRFRPALHRLRRRRQRRRSVQLGAEPGVGVRQDPAHRSARQRTARTASTAFRPTIRSSRTPKPDTLGEIYAYGVRNPQRFSWDAKTGSMFVADIGQNIVEEISPVTAGANLGWNKWEGSYRVRRRGGRSTRRSRAASRADVSGRRIRSARSAASSDARGDRRLRLSRNAIRQLAEPADLRRQPERRDLLRRRRQAAEAAGRRRIRRILFNDKGTSKTLLQLIQEKNTAQGKPPATRADLRFGEGPQGQIFLLNKRDGIIRLLVPDPAPAR